MKLCKAKPIVVYQESTSTLATARTFVHVCVQEKEPLTCGKGKHKI